MNKHNTNEAIEGEVLQSSYDDTTQSNEDKVNKPRNAKLSVKASKFIKNYTEGDTMGNGTKSAIKAGYSEISASSYASQLLKNPKVLMVLNGKVEEAERVISDLMYTADSDAIKLSAAKEVLDRTIGKPIVRTQNESVTISVEMMLDSSDS